MQRPVLFRAIYAELRSTLGREVPAADLLKLAFEVMRAYAIDQDGLPEDGRIGFSRLFASLPVDEAMRDGGWRVLDFEERRVYSRDDCDVGALTALRPLIEKYLGPEWQHPTLTRPLYLQ
jgi:hypothetical protein